MADPLFAPLLVHTSHASETHYFPLTSPSTRRILLHSHGVAPHVHSKDAPSFGLSFAVYSSGPHGCKPDLVGLDISIDWSATLGRWASRYFTVLPVWATGVVAFIVFQAWGISDAGGKHPHIPTALAALIAPSSDAHCRSVYCNLRREAAATFASVIYPFFRNTAMGEVLSWEQGRAAALCHCAAVATRVERCCMSQLVVTASTSLAARET